MTEQQILQLIDNLYNEINVGRYAKDLDCYEPEDLDEVAEDYEREGFLSALMTIKNKIKESK